MRKKSRAKDYGVVEHPNSGGVTGNVPSVFAIGKGVNISFSILVG